MLAGPMLVVLGPDARSPVASRSKRARKSIDWEVLLAIAASFALGTALEKPGAARDIAKSTTALAGGSPWISLALMYFVTLVVTELITNNAAAALMFPFAMATAQRLDVSYMPFVIAVMMAASAGFATPIGYQTNLMVYGPGGYRFSDYVKDRRPARYPHRGSSPSQSPRSCFRSAPRGRRPACKEFFLHTQETPKPPVAAGGFSFDSGLSRRPPQWYVRQARE